MAEHSPSERLQSAESAWRRAQAAHDFRDRALRRAQEAHSLAAEAYERALLIRLRLGDGDAPTAARKGRETG